MEATPHTSVAVVSAATFGTGVAQLPNTILAGHTITGGVISFTVTVDTQLFTLPAASVTVNTT